VNAEIGLGRIPKATKSDSDEELFVLNIADSSFSLLFKSSYSEVNIVF
jgi:hypothetical protein